MAIFQLSLPKRLSFQSRKRKRASLNPNNASIHNPNSAPLATLEEEFSFSEPHSLLSYQQRVEENTTRFHFTRTISAPIRTQPTYILPTPSAVSLELDEDPRLEGANMEAECCHGALNKETQHHHKRFSMFGPPQSAADKMDAEFAANNRRHTFRSSMLPNWKRKSSVSPPLLQEEHSSDLTSASRGTTGNSLGVPIHELSIIDINDSNNSNGKKASNRRSMMLFTKPLDSIAEKRTEKKERRKTMSEQLLSAAATGDTAGVGMLISAGCSPCRCDSASGIYPVHHAAAGGHVGTLKGLIEHGARVDVKNRAGRTPLHVAVLNGRTEMVHLLVKLGAAIDEPDKWGFTALHLAASQKNADGLAAAASFPSPAPAAEGTESSSDNDYEKETTNTTITYQRSAGQTTWVRPGSMIIHNTTRSSVLHPSPSTTTANPTTRHSLHNNQPSTNLSHHHNNHPQKITDTSLEALLRAGANPDAKDDKGDTPLHIAVKSGSAANSKALLNAGARLSAKNEDGLTPLSALVTLGSGIDPELSRLLLERGALLDGDIEGLGGGDVEEVQHAKL